MVLDNEGQRKNLLEVIRQVPVQATMEDAIVIINMLKQLEYSVQEATIAEPKLEIVEQEKAAE